MRNSCGYNSVMKTPFWLENWLERHQSRFSFWLHMIGIPMTIAAVVVAIVQLVQGRWDLWWRPVVLLVGGYLLQAIGHWYEGNTMGEIILIRKLRGRPYVAVSPRYANRRTADRQEAA